MALTISFRTAPSGGGHSITSYDFGTVNKNATSSAYTLYVSHNGTDGIADCTYSLGETDTTYLGDSTVYDDAYRVGKMGEGSLGVQINQVSATPVWASLTKTGRIALFDDDAPGRYTSGTLGTGRESYLQIRVKMPGSGVTTGNTYQVGLVMHFTYTS